MDYLIEPVIVCRDLPHSGVLFYTGDKENPWSKRLVDAARFHPMDSPLENLGFEKPWIHNIFTVKESFYARESN